MQLHQKIIQARKSRGLTQEDLAASTQITVRTIQRIESGESSPRPFTLKAIAQALSIPFEDLVAPANAAPDAPPAAVTEQAAKVSDLPAAQPAAQNHQYFLQMHCLSCFSYLVIPFLHFLLPAWLLKRSGDQPAAVTAFAQKTIQTQVYWQIGLHGLLLSTVAYNFTRSHYYDKTGLLHYLWPVFLMYACNSVVIALRLRKIHRVAATV